MTSRTWQWFSHWGWVILYIGVIYATLSLTPGMVKGVYKSIGKQSFSIGIDLLLVGIVVWIGLIARHRPFRDLLWVLIPVGLTAFFAINMPNPVERIHFLEYGSLGWLVFRNLQRTGWQSGIQAFVVVFLIGLGDELIQGWLPNRYWDIRDVLMNGTGGALGVWMGYLLTLPVDHPPSPVSKSP